MALGKQQRNDGKAYSLKLKLKEGDLFLDCAHFDVQEKQGDAYVTIAKETDVSGDLFSLSTRLGDFNGQPIRSFKAGLRDAAKNEAYFVDVSLGSSVGRNLANSLLNLKDFKGVEIGLYGQKNKETRKVYPAVALRQGGNTDTVKWAYDPKTTPELAVREFKGKGGKIEKDYSGAEEFLFAKLTEFGKVVEANRPARQEAPANEDPAPAANEPADSDIPF